MYLGDKTLKLIEETLGVVKESREEKDNYLKEILDEEYDFLIKTRNKIKSFFDNTLDLLSDTNEVFSVKVYETSYNPVFHIEMNCNGEESYVTLNIKDSKYMISSVPSMYRGYLNSCGDTYCIGMDSVKSLFSDTIDVNHLKNYLKVEQQKEFYNVVTILLLNSEHIESGIKNKISDYKKKIVNAYEYEMSVHRTFLDMMKKYTDEDK